MEIPDQEDNMKRKPLLMVWACLCLAVFAGSQIRSEEKQTSPSPEAQEPFSIKDKRLLQASGPDPCHTDAQIHTSGSKGYQVGGMVEIFNGQPYLWCNGAKHTWIGRHENIEGAIAVIDSSKDEPLQFKVDKEKGYVYQKGKGTVTLLDGKVVQLPVGLDVAPPPKVSSSALLNVAGDWEGSSSWKGIRFTITLSVPENSREINSLKVTSECTEGTGGMSATLTQPVMIQTDNNFDFTAGQGSKGTGRFVSEDSVEGTYKAPLSMKCGNQFVEISGKWTAQKKRK